LAGRLVPSTVGYVLNNNDGLFTGCEGPGGLEEMRETCSFHPAFKVHPPYGNKNKYMSSNRFLPFVVFFVVCPAAFEYLDFLSPLFLLPFRGGCTSYFSLVPSYDMENQYYAKMEALVKMCRFYIESSLSKKSHLTLELRVLVGIGRSGMIRGRALS